MNRRQISVHVAWRTWLVGPQRDGHASGSKPAAAEAEAAADEDRSAALSAAAAGACQWSMYVRTRMEWRVFRAFSQRPTASTLRVKPMSIRRQPRLPHATRRRSRSVAAAFPHSVWYQAMECCGAACGARGVTFRASPFNPSHHINSDRRRPPRRAAAPCRA